MIYEVTHLVRLWARLQGGHVSP